MIHHIFKDLFRKKPWEQALDAEYEPYQEELRLAGLDEEGLRSMNPDDYIYLAC